MESVASSQNTHEHPGAFSRFHQAHGKTHAVPGREEEVARSHFEAFHRSHAQFDYPPSRTGVRRAVLSIAGMLLLVLSVLAIAAWMNPALLPEGAALLKVAGAAIGLERPAGLDKEADVRFGTSPGELPYDGNAAPDAVPDTAVEPMNPPEPSSGNSGAPENDAGASASGTEAVSTAADDDETADKKDVAPTPAPVSKTRPAPSTKPHSKQMRISRAVRKREISRLRRQAEDELYAE